MFPAAVSPSEVGDSDIVPPSINSRSHGRRCFTPEESAIIGAVFRAEIEAGSVTMPRVRARIHDERLAGIKARFDPKCFPEVLRQKVRSMYRKK